MDRRRLAVCLRPDLRLRHRFQHVLGLRVLVHGVGLNLEAIDGLEKLRLLVQQLTKRELLALLVGVRVVDAEPGLKIRIGVEFKFRTFF